jgi:hypothetical protein
MFIYLKIYKRNLKSELLPDIFSTIFLLFSTKFAKFAAETQIINFFIAQVAGFQVKAI